jgi:GNAT superfamily N-acetyltransferase
MNVTLRRIASGDGPLLRDLRLRALSDSPTAFSSRHEDEAARSPEEWEARAVARAEGAESCTFIAEGDSGTLGLAGGYFPAPGDAELVSMWVDPAARGRGTGLALVHGVLGWARAAGADSVALWVTEGNAPAERLYERAGFAFTGERQPLPQHPGLFERRMLLPLSTGD